MGRGGGQNEGERHDHQTSSSQQRLSGSWCRKANTTSSNRKRLAHHKARVFETQRKSALVISRDRQRDKNRERERERLKGGLMSTDTDTIIIEAKRVGKNLAVTNCRSLLDGRRNVAQLLSTVRLTLR